MRLKLSTETRLTIALYLSAFGGWLYEVAEAPEQVGAGLILSFIGIAIAERRRDKAVTAALNFSMMLAQIR